jgi:hypothetical protein
VARAWVAVPFVIATGFALRAITVMLVERFGHVVAYWMLAGGLTAIGAIAIAVSVKEHEEEKAALLAEATDTEEVVRTPTPTPSCKRRSRCLARSSQPVAERLQPWA